jgi:hypothetical protein
MITPQQTPLERAAHIAAAVVFACTVVFSLQFALHHDVRHLLLRVVDDAGYYMNTAQNMALGHGMTFDGIHPTNGFHPLWLLMLVPLFLFHGTPETMVRLVVLLQILLLSVAFLLLYRTQSRLFSRRAALLSGIGFLWLVFMQSVNGMESALFALLLVMLYAYGLKISQGPISWERAALFGVILGLLLLSRLDMIFIPLAMLPFSISYVKDPATRSRALIVVTAAGAATTAIVAPYLLFNLMQFGSPMPISGALKSSFPAIALGHGTFSAFNNRHYVIVGFAALWLLWRIIKTRTVLARPTDGYYSLATAVLAWAVILHFLDTILFLRWGVFAWHFILYPLFAVIALAGVVDWALKRSLLGNHRGLYWLAPGIMLVLAIRNEYARETYPLDHAWHVAAYNAAVWARQHTAADTVFAMSDAGHFAFFSGRRVINLDGLVNNLDYQRVIAARRVRQYLRDNHVQYLVLHAVRGREDVIRGQYESLSFNYVSHKYGVVSDDVVVREGDEVYRSAPYFDDREPAVFLIWALDTGGARGALRSVASLGRR